MTSWCIDNVWKHMALPADTDDICNICIDMVTQARDQLNSNETQEELKEVLEGSCNLIPIHIVAEECDTLVDQFQTELTQMLTSEMNPQVVCQTAGLCNSARVDKLLAAQAEKDSPPQAVDVCSTCKQRTEALKQHVSTEGKQQLLDHLLPVCRELGSYSDACAADLASNIQPIYELMRQLDGQGACMMGNACPGLYGEETQQQLQLTGPVDCDLCIHIVKHWRDILVANTTKEEFKEILDGICGKTKAWAPKCTQLVNEYYEVIYDFLVNQMRAHTICQAIGLCSKPGPAPPMWLTVPAGSEAAAVLKSQPRARMPLVSLHPAVVPLARLTPPKPAVVPLARLTPPQVPLARLTPPKLHTVSLKKTPVKVMKKLHHVSLKQSPPRAYGNDGLSHFNPLDSGARPVPADQLPLRRLGLPDLSTLLAPNSELCDLCEFALQQLQKVLEADATEDEITNAVESVCTLLPAALTTQCREFVEKYGDFVITLLAQEIDPSEVCPALRLCSLPAAEMALLPEADRLSAAQAVDEKPGCAICEYAMTTVFDMLKDQKTVREIRDALDRVCAMLPHDVSRKCQEIVNTFTESIIDMIVSGYTPDEICAAIQLCQLPPTGANDVVSNSIRAVPLTNLQFSGLMAPLAGLPVNSPSMPETAPWAELADSWESSEEQEDQEPVFLPVRVKRPESQLDSSSEEEGESSEEEETSSVCVLCEFVMMQLKMQLADNATDEEIEKALEGICAHFPGTIRDDCTGFMSEYGAALLEAVKEAVDDPDKACIAISLCQPAAGLEGRQMP